MFLVVFCSNFSLSQFGDATLYCSNASSFPLLFNAIIDKLPGCILNLLLKSSFFLCISESQDVSCWGCNVNSTLAFLQTYTKPNFGIKLQPQLLQYISSIISQTNKAHFLQWNQGKFTRIISKQETKLRSPGSNENKFLWVSFTLS